MVGVSGKCPTEWFERVRLFVENPERIALFNLVHHSLWTSKEALSIHSILYELILYWFYRYVFANIVTYCVSCKVFFPRLLPFASVQESTLQAHQAAQRRVVWILSRKNWPLQHLNSSKLSTAQVSHLLSGSTQSFAASSIFTSECEGGSFICTTVSITVFSASLGDDPTKTSTCYEHHG